MTNEAQRPSVNPAELLHAPEMLQEVMTFQAGIRDKVRLQLQRQSAAELSKVVADGTGDVTYKIDAHAEEKLVPLLKIWHKNTP